MKTASRVMLALMVVLALIHLVDFVRDRHLYDLLAAIGFGLLGYSNVRMGDTQVGPDGRYVRVDRRAQSMGFVGAALVVGYFVMKYAGIG